MKANTLGAVVAATLLGWAGASFAQTSSYGSGESARCNTMPATGASASED